jgi:Ribbon-helix-helix protein, copG family
MPSKSNKSSQNKHDEGKKTMPNEKLPDEQTPVDKRRSKERIQFDFSIDALERLDHIKELTGASTRAEAIRQALRLYEWFVTETDPSDTITIKDKDNVLLSTFKAKLLHNSMKSE